MTQLKRIGIWSLAKIKGVVGIFLGLIAGVVAQFIGGKPIALVAGPVIGGVGGGILGALSALSYNISAWIVGGMEIRLWKRNR
ncbi:MAG: hypothetical protein SVV03_00245 [Candidatus Nanohaloarchaea archaeon]|nr:hypothetical protein [Candidatus Nanohaloarchaea archaeon]